MDPRPGLEGCGKSRPPTGIRYKYNFINFLNFIPKDMYLCYVLLRKNIPVRFEFSNPCDCEHFPSVSVVSLMMATY